MRFALQEAGVGSGRAWERSMAVDELGDELVDETIDETKNELMRKRGYMRGFPERYKVVEVAKSRGLTM